MDILRYLMINQSLGKVYQCLGTSPVKSCEAPSKVVVLSKVGRKEGLSCRGRQQSHRDVGAPDTYREAGQNTLLQLMQLERSSPLRRPVLMFSR